MSETEGNDQAVVNENAGQSIRVQFNDPGIPTEDERQLPDPVNAGAGRVYRTGIDGQTVQPEVQKVSYTPPTDGTSLLATVQTAFGGAVTSEIQPDHIVEVPNPGGKPMKTTIAACLSNGWLRRVPGGFEETEAGKALFAGQIDSGQPGTTQDPGEAYEDKYAVSLRPESAADEKMFEAALSEGGVNSLVHRSISAAITSNGLMPDEVSHEAQAIGISTDEVIQKMGQIWADHKAASDRWLASEGLDEGQRESFYQFMRDTLPREELQERLHYLYVTGNTVRTFTAPLERWKASRSTDEVVEQRLAEKGVQFFRGRNGERLVKVPGFPSVMAEAVARRIGLI